MLASPPVQLVIAEKTQWWDGGSLEDSGQRRHGRAAEGEGRGGSALSRQQAAVKSDVGGEGTDQVMQRGREREGCKRVAAAEQRKAGCCWSRAGGGEAVATKGQRLTAKVSAKAQRAQLSAPLLASSSAAAHRSSHTLQDAAHSTLIAAPLPTSWRSRPATPHWRPLRLPAPPKPRSSSTSPSSSGALHLPHPHSLHTPAHLPCSPSLLPPLQRWSGAVVRQGEAPPRASVAGRGRR